MQRLFDRYKVPVVNGTSWCRWNYWGYLVQRDGVGLIQDNGVRSSFQIDPQKEAVKTALMQADLLCAEVGCVSVLTTPCTCGASPFVKGEYTTSLRIAINARDEQIQQITVQPAGSAESPLD